MDAPGAAVFGRERELASIAGFLAGAIDLPGALVLAGDPGMGKTTLWRAGIADAEKRGFAILSCSPASGETQLSFAGLADLIGSSVASVSGELPVPQRRALEAALLLDDPAAEGAQPRTVLAATLSALRTLAQRRPTLIAIDDMQWLDESSAEALAFAVRRLGESPVSILAARRTESSRDGRAPLEEALEHRHGPALQRMQVGALSAAALYDAIRERLGVTFPHSVVNRIHAASGGNPFYALELGRTLARLPEPPDPGSELPVPETLQQVVGQRLADLSPAAQELLAIVASLSDPSLATVEASGAADAIDEVVGAGVIEIDSTRRLRFVHPLLAAGASARLAPRARRALHARLANLVDGEERARHLALGASGPSVEVAQALQEAARQAAGRGAIGTAAELAEQAIRLSPPDRLNERHERQLEAAKYELPHGDTERARSHLEPLLRELPPGPMRAGVLVQLARIHEQHAVLGLALCKQAIEEAGPTDVRAAEAHQLAAEMSMLSGDIPGALGHARLACQVAERAEDKVILIESLGTLCHYQTYTGSIEPGLLEDAVELERRHTRPTNNYSPREILGLRLMYSDRLDEARRLLEASYATAVEIGDESDRGSLLIHMAQLECRAGNLAVADRHAREAAMTREQSGLGPAGPRFANALVGAHLGRVEQARADAEEGARLAAEGGNELFRVLNLWVLGFLEQSLDDASAADRHLRALPEAVDRMGYRNPGVRPLYADAIEARIGSGDLAVEGLIDDLEQRGRELDIPWARAASSRCRGILLAASSDVEGATAQFEHALAEHERSPQPFERGRTLLAFGTMLRRAKRRREARESLGRALEIFDSVGAPLWAEKAAAEMARIPGRTAASGGLTETERRVAELVALGLSNREVAARLFVSVRTVEANLSSIYAKLGLRSRTELASRFGQR